MNRDFWSIAKGIGIFMVVFGHVCSNFQFAVHFVYLFHLALFFFISGYLWNEEKYGGDPFRNFAARMKNTWSRYFFAAAVFVLLHNSFLDIGILVNQEKYDGNQIVISLVTSLMLNCTESMSSSLWFVPLLVISSTIFSSIVMAGCATEKCLRGGIICPLCAKNIVILLGSFMCGTLGYYATSCGWGFHYNMQIALLVVPIYVGAYYIRIILPDIERSLKWFLALPLFLLLCYGIKDFGWEVMLSHYKVCGNILTFYFVSFVGIYVSLFSVKIINKIKYIRQYFIFIGKYSFEIMAWHLLVVKLIDVGYAKIIGEADKQVYGVFTNAYAESLWFVYLILGTLLPAFCAKGLKLLKNKCSPYIIL